MTKKLDFQREQQSRLRHPDGEPETDPTGESDAAAEPTADPDRQEPGTGKVANDHNSTGDKPATQTNQGRRTPQSRNDRQSIGAGPQNQVSARKGGGGAGRSPRGSG